MSFDVFLHCFTEKDGVGKFPRSIVDETLGPYVKRVPLQSGSVSLDLYFDDHYGGTLYIDDDEMIRGFSVNRPGGKELYSILLDIMKQTSSALYWAGGMAVTDPSIIPNLWEGVTTDEEISFRVVHTVDELLEHIQST